MSRSENILIKPGKREHRRTLKLNELNSKSQKKQDEVKERKAEEESRYQDLRLVKLHRLTLRGQSGDDRRKAA